MVELRPYQQELYGQALAAIADAPAGDPAHVMLQCPTGGGKTEIAGEVVRKLLGPSSVVVWLTHRQELRRQLVQRYTEAAIPVHDLAGDTPTERRLRARHRLHSHAGDAGSRGPAPIRGA